MKSLSGVGLGLSVVFGCLLLAFVGELYYLFYWKRRLNTTKNNKEVTRSEDYSSPAREFFYLFCFKKPTSFRHDVCSSAVRIITVNQEQENQEQPVVLDQFGQLQVNNNRTIDLFFNNNNNNNSVEETELLFCGPSRFLFTIVEETKEDLESEDGKLSRAVSVNNNNNEVKKESRRLSDLLLNLEETTATTTTTTPYLTPLASPSLFTPPLTPINHYHHHPSSASSSNHHHNFRFEFSTEAEFNKIRSSPPPKFKFLQDAEDKLYRKTLSMQEPSRDKKQCEITKNGFDQDCERKCGSSSKVDKDEEDGSFITINVVDRSSSKEREVTSTTSTSQVLPLASSPAITTTASTTTRLKSKPKINYIFS